jgi:hypothetical protein
MAQKPRILAARVCMASCAVALLLIPLVTAGAYIKGLAQPGWIHVYGEQLVGTTRLSCMMHGGTLYLHLSNGWKDAQPVDWTFTSMPGLVAFRQAIVLNDPRPQGDVITSAQIRWWLLFLVNVPPLAIGWMLLRRAWRGRPVGGRCQHCGYDLRATPQRCPECGTVAAGSAVGSA